MSNNHNADEAALRSINVEIILPQRPPFIMIDCLVAYDHTLTATETTVRADNIFVDDGVLTTEGIMENIAQTCAARIGYYNKIICNNDVKIGVIGAVRNLEVKRHPEIGEVIGTVIVVTEEIFGMSLADATVSCNGETVATAQIKIAINDRI